MFDSGQSGYDPRGVCTCVVEGHEYETVGDVSRVEMQPAPHPGSSEAATVLPLLFHKGVRREPQELESVIFVSCADGPFICFTLNVTMCGYCHIVKCSVATPQREEDKSTGQWISI